MISKLIASAILLLALTPQGKHIAQETLPRLPQAPPPQAAPIQVTPIQATPPQAAPLQEIQRSIFLLRLKCVDTGIGNWSRQTQDIAVGKAVYRSRLYMGPGDRSASMTCQLQPNQGGVTFQTLQLEFGMRDNDQGSPGAVVNVYLDGKQVETRTVAPGQGASVLRDVANVKNISLEVVCTSRNRLCERVYFWNASLNYLLVSPQ